MPLTARQPNPCRASPLWSLVVLLICVRLLDFMSSHDAIDTDQYDCFHDGDIATELVNKSFFHLAWFHRGTTRPLNARRLPSLGKSEFHDGDIATELLDKSFVHLRHVAWFHRDTTRPLNARRLPSLGKSEFFSTKKPNIMSRWTSGPLSRASRAACAHSLGSTSPNALRARNLFPSVRLHVCVQWRD